MYNIIRTSSLSLLVLIAVLGIPAMFLIDSYVGDNCPDAASAQDNPCASQEMTMSVMERDLEEATVVIDDYIATIAVLETAVAASDESVVRVSDELNENNLPTWAIEHVRTRGGVEIFEAPDPTSERLYAADANLYPHVVGRTADGEWLYIYYFVDGRLRDHWIPTEQTTLLDEQVEALPEIDPDDLPVRPDVVFTERANMTLRAAKPTGTSIPTLAPQATSGSPPTIIPPPSTPTTGT